MSISFYGPYIIDSTTNMDWLYNGGETYRDIIEGETGKACYLVWGISTTDEEVKTIKLTYDSEWYKNLSGNTIGSTVLLHSDTQTLESDADAFGGAEQSGVNVFICNMENDSTNCWYLHTSRGTVAVAFDARWFDYCKLTVKITATLASGSSTSYTGYITFNTHAKCELAAFRYVDINTLELEYTTSYARQDDNCALMNTCTADGEQFLTGSWIMTHRSISVNSDGTRTVKKRLSTEYTTRSPLSASCNLLVYVYHTWDTYTQGQRLTATLTCEGSGNCDVPIATPSIVGNSVSIGLNYHEIDEDGFGTWENPPEKAYVKLRGSDWTFDSAESHVEGAVTLNRCPLNTPLVFEVIGARSVTSSGETVEYVSDLVLVEAIIETGDTAIDTIDGTLSLALKYKIAGENRGPSISVSNDVVLKQLAGHDFQSAFYGGASSESLSFSGVLVDDIGLDWETLGEIGLCSVRFPDGRRYIANVTVQIENARNGITNVSCSAQRVDYS